jgi:peptide-methionine (S)-S-oxide reductase
MNWIWLVAGVLAMGLSTSSAQSAEGRTREAPPPAPGLEVATFAAGCFWCLEPPFDKLDGVVSTTSGYTQGKTVGPSYEEVSAGGTGHTEAVQVVYDPARISYRGLLDTYWRNVDPLDDGGQFCDRGRQYRPGIYTHGEEQRRLAEASKAALEASGRFDQPIVVEIKPTSAFYVAEDYHQNYYVENPLRYKFYRWSCGRDSRLEELWGEEVSHAKGLAPRRMVS